MALTFNIIINMMSTRRHRNLKGEMRWKFAYAAQISATLVLQKRALAHCHVLNINDLHTKTPQHPLVRGPVADATIQSLIVISVCQDGSSDPQSEEGSWIHIQYVPLTQAKQSESCLC